MYRNRHAFSIARLLVCLCLYGGRWWRVCVSGSPVKNLLRFVCFFWLLLLWFTSVPPQTSDSFAVTLWLRWSLFLRGTFFVCSMSPPLCACPSERDSLHTLSPPRSKLWLLVPLRLAYWWGEGGFRLKTGYFCCSASASVLGKLCLWGGVLQPSSWSCPAPSVRFL